MAKPVDRFHTSPTFVQNFATMTESLKDFLTASDKKSFDKEHKRKLLFNISQYDKKVVEGKLIYSDLNLARERASHLKTKAITNLDKYLIEFEAAFVKRGGKVLWAENAEQAINEVLKIAKRINAKTLVKAKSMVTEEIHLNHHMEKAGIESIETDLGEYIQQLDGEPPYHIVTPAMHKSKEDVAKLFHEKKGLPEGSSPSDIMAYVRRILREKYAEAELGITGGNFLVADIGAIGITENESNQFMSVAFPKTIISIVGIEKMIPTLADLDLFFPLLAVHGTGQKVTVYNTLLTGPRQSEEPDGPDEMYVILLDNGRTNLLAQPDQREALNCIRCGACLNACPIYRNVGGHSYATTYSGPIGSVITPHLSGFDDFRHLSFASSLCGRCTEVCPVKIDIHKHLLHNRRDTVNQNYPSKVENLSMFFWKKVTLSRKNMNKGGASVKNFFLNSFFKSAWGDRREMPQLAQKSFNERWREKKGLK